MRPVGAEIRRRIPDAVYQPGFPGELVASSRIRLRRKVMLESFPYYLGFRFSARRRRALEFLLQLGTNSNCQTL